MNKIFHETTSCHQTTLSEGSPKPHDYHFALGRHLTLECYHCDPLILNDLEGLKQAFLETAKRSGATIIDFSFRVFAPQGISGFIVIAESHISVHTWPEYNYAAVDIFSCGDALNFQTAIDSLKEALSTEDVVVSADMGRGYVSNNGLERIVVMDSDRKEHLLLSWKEMFEIRRAWGISTSIDLYECDPYLIKNIGHIKGFVGHVSDWLKAKLIGECLIIGENGPMSGGLKMVQFLESSQVSAHFDDYTNAVYLDIQSQKYYSSLSAVELAFSFFKAKNYKMQIHLRQ